jgi:rfaE bifunctional protein kinase chain/domain
MSPLRFDALTARYPALRVAIVGDFCLDRYLEIDPAKTETSLETGQPVHNVVRVRSQPGAAGTILNNLVALGMGMIWPVGFCGADGEGFELQRALGALTNVRLDHFLQTEARRTFTYCKPLVVAPGQVPVELNRLDSKNWTPTPLEVSDRLAAGLEALSAQVDAVILMDQVDRPDTGVVTQRLLATVGRIAARRPDLPVLADSRRGLRGFPPVILKMNARELAVLTDTNAETEIARLKPIAATLARRHGRRVFVTLAERGMIGATPEGETEHVAALPSRGPIDIVGAGDAVTANLTAALAAGATLGEAMELAMTAASVVIHQLGTTGTASVEQVRELAVPAS